MTLKRTVDVKFRMTMGKIGACHASCPQALEESCLIQNLLKYFLTLLNGLMTRSTSNGQCLSSTFLQCCMRFVDKSNIRDLWKPSFVFELGFLHLLTLLLACWLANATYAIIFIVTTPFFIMSLSHSLTCIVSCPFITTGTFGNCGNR